MYSDYSRRQHEPERRYERTNVTGRRTRYVNVAYLAQRGEVLVMWACPDRVSAKHGKCGSAVWHPIHSVYLRGLGLPDCSRALGATLQRR